MTCHKDAINLAHDLRRPFCYLQFNEAGRVMSITPYYNEGEK